MSLLRGRRYNRRKQKREDNPTQNAPIRQSGGSEETATRLAREHGVAARGGTGANQYTAQKCQSGTLKTAEKLAAEHGDVPRTINGGGQFAEAVASGQTAGDAP